MYKVVFSFTISVWGKHKLPKHPLMCAMVKTCQNMVHIPIEDDGHQSTFHRIQ